MIYITKNVFKSQIFKKQDKTLTSCPFSLKTKQMQLSRVACENIK
jgi:hypothetical protein